MAYTQNFHGLQDGRDCLILSASNLWHPDTPSTFQIFPVYSNLVLTNLTMDMGTPAIFGALSPTLHQRLKRSRSQEANLKSSRRTANLVGQPFTTGSCWSFCSRTMCRQIAFQRIAILTADWSNSACLQLLGSRFARYGWAWFKMMIVVWLSFRILRSLFILFWHESYATSPPYSSNGLIHLWFWGPTACAPDWHHCHCHRGVQPPGQKQKCDHGIDFAQTCPIGWSYATQLFQRKNQKKIMAMVGQAMSSHWFLLVCVFWISSWLIHQKVWDAHVIQQLPINVLVHVVSCCIILLHFDNYLGRICCNRNTWRRIIIEHNCRYP